jgi:hypothetical protein
MVENAVMALADAVHGIPKALITGLSTWGVSERRALDYLFRPRRVAWAKVAPDVFPSVREACVAAAGAVLY